MNGNVTFWLVILLYFLGDTVHDTYRHDQPLWLLVWQWLTIALGGVTVLYHWRKERRDKH